ncbi:hypothetical protein M0805_005407 [Coniferiporia weirii]|nr:hypothetical protein M0805_005407 [Coniferiporia weirii]
MAFPSSLTLGCLPTEIYTIVFELACSADPVADEHDYRTALDLCLVSRRFYSLVVPILYRALLVTGRAKVSLLARTLRARPELGQSTVHLFLSDRVKWAPGAGAASHHPNHVDDESSLEVLPSFAFEFPRSREGRVERLQRMQTWLTAHAETLATFRIAVGGILDVLSPRLRTLAICLYRYYMSSADSGLSEALGHPFPSLIELTVREDSQPQPCEQLELPALERVHLAGGNPPHPFMTLGALLSGCPRLSHVRLSEPLINDAAVSALEAALATGDLAGGGSEPDSTGSDDFDNGGGGQLAPPRESNSASAYREPGTASGPPGVGGPYPPRRALERFILEPSSFVLTGTPVGGGAGPEADVSGRLGSLAARVQALELVVRTPPAGGKRADRYALDDALRDWCERIEGGAGCWRSRSAENK